MNLSVFIKKKKNHHFASKFCNYFWVLSFEPVFSFPNTQVLNSTGGIWENVTFEFSLFQ